MSHSTKIFYRNGHMDRMHGFEKGKLANTILNNPEGGWKVYGIRSRNKSYSVGPFFLGVFVLLTKVEVVVRMMTGHGGQSSESLGSLSVKRNRFLLKSW